MSSISYNEDSGNHLAEESQEILPEDLATSLPDISVTSGSAEDEVEVVATTPTKGFNRGKATKMGVALLALAAVILSAVIFGTNRPNKGPNTLADSTKIAKAIEFEPTFKPTFKPTANNAALSKSSPKKAPTEAKAVKQPAIIPPKPAPLMTPFPTEEASGQTTETVSTETTGPPTVAGRDDTRV